MIIPDLPPGHVRVLIERSTTPQLIAAARAVVSGENPAGHIERYNRNKSAGSPELDPTFGAIPIGPGGRADEIPAAQLDPGKSKKFLARAFVEAASYAKVNERIDKDFVYSDPTVAGMLTCGASRAVGDADDVRAKLDTTTLDANGLTGAGVAIAIVDSGIYLPRITQLLGQMRPGAAPAYDAANSWKPLTLSTKPFRHRLGHGTMCAYDALIAAPKATLLDYPMLLARAPGDHSSYGTVSAASLAYAPLISKWVVGPTQGTKPPYNTLVVSNSWGIYHPSLEDFPPGHSGRFIDNPRHAFRTYVIQPLVQAGVDIIFAGHNCGRECPAAMCLSRTDYMIMGANTYREVLTIAGCDVNDDRVGYSSRGPSIPGMHPQKPDLTAYTHFLGAKARRIFVPDTGVSAACPVAAGCVAALRTKVSPNGTPPGVLFDTLRATARAGVGGGPGGVWNDQYGFGIIDPVAAGRSLGVI